MRSKGRDFSLHYKLDADNRPVPCSFEEWTSDFEARRQLAETLTERCRVSTIFLGLDSGWGDGPPIVFETMVFEKEPHEFEMDGEKYVIHEDLEQHRYSSYDDAMTGHRAAVSRILRMERGARKLSGWDKVKKDLPHE